MKKIAILQSNYIPWKGVFDMMHQVDEFVFLEDVQYTKRDWRNRNKIQTDKGLRWLTIPVESNSTSQLLCEVRINNNEPWAMSHFDLIRRNYLSAPYFDKYKGLLEQIYLEKKFDLLSEFNIYTNILIARELGISIKFVNSFDLCSSGKKDDKLIEICSKLGATHYLSGPAAQNYIIEDKFNRNNIKLEYINYSYPEYVQLSNHFEHGTTILDLIFNCGNNSNYYIWGYRNKV